MTALAASIAQCSFDDTGRGSVGVFANKHGAMLLMFALLLIPLLGMLGLAVDATRVYAVRSQVETCLRAAVSAGRLGHTAAERQAAVELYYQMNWDIGHFAANSYPLIFATNPFNGDIGVVAVVDVPLFLMPLLGKNIATIEQRAIIHAAQLH